MEDDIKVLGLLGNKHDKVHSFFLNRYWFPQQIITIYNKTLYYCCSDLHPGPEGVDDDDVAVDGDDGERQGAHVHREALEGAEEQGVVALNQLVQLEVYIQAHGSRRD